VPYHEDMRELMYSSIILNLGSRWRQVVSCTSERNSSQYHNIRGSVDPIAGLLCLADNMICERFFGALHSSVIIIVDKILYISLL
jgi:hypothetical protein